MNPLSFQCAVDDSCTVENEQLGIWSISADWHMIIGKIMFKYTVATTDEKEGSSVTLVNDIDISTNSWKHTLTDDSNQDTNEDNIIYSKEHVYTNPEDVEYDAEIGYSISNNAGGIDYRLDQ